MSRLTIFDPKQSLQLLGNISAEQFIDDYWQKKPLLIRNAISHFISPINADELAGLSLEDQVSSRLVIEKDGDYPWQVIYSPFDESVFSQLPETHWTLLVSDVEKHLPEFADICDQFRFIPDWRIDDLMISYAPEGGSVGPHIDRYDVFLLQAHGQRRWQITEQPIDIEEYIPDLDIRVLKTFDYDHDWVLNPGDLLYLPPRIAHHGVALDDCMTYSVGFRANSHAELVNAYADYLSNHLDSSLRYTDADLIPQSHPAEITPSAIQKLKQILTKSIQLDSQNLQHWFGQFITEPKHDLLLTAEQPYNTLDEFIAELNTQQTIVRHNAIRFAYIPANEHADLYINGDLYTVSTAFAEIISGPRVIDIQRLVNNIQSEAEQELLFNLYNNGMVYFDYER